MSFVKKNINLPGGNMQGAHPLKTSSKCQQERVPEGGIEMGPGRWMCAICWTLRVVKRPLK